MDQLAQDLTVALEESESCGAITFSIDNNPGNWQMRRRTRSTGNLHLCGNNSGDNQSDDSSSTNSEMRNDKNRSNKQTSFHQSDSDELSLAAAVARAMRNKSLKMKNSLYVYPDRFCRLRVNNYLESDSVNENSPARPSLRRKRKLKRMSVDETPIPSSGKRKRSHRLDIVDSRHRIKPLHQSLVDRIEKFCQSSSSIDENNLMETQSIEDCEFASESSISWSGGEGHDGDDELTDWGPPINDTTTIESTYTNDTDPREIRAGRRLLGDGRRPGFRISTGANERVAKFLQDTTKSELRVLGAEREKMGQLARLYSLDLLFDGPTSSMLRKTNKTPCMQPTQKHPSGLLSAHKRIKTQRHLI